MPDFSSLGDLDDTPYPEYQDLLVSCQYSTIEKVNQSVLYPSQLSVIHINVRSLQRNFDALQLLLSSLKTKPSIILITETWLDPSLSKSYMLDGYQLEVSSQLVHRGKGTAMYICSSLPYSRRRDLESSNEQYQTVFVELKTSCNKLAIIGTAYRSPSFPANEFIDFLELTLVKLTDEHKFCSIGGDFNIDILKHKSEDGCSQFVNSLASSGVFPCISLPTRITSHSATLIDNFVCNDPSCIESSGVMISDISDHLPIFINIKLNFRIQKKSVAKHARFDFRNIETLKQNLSCKLPNIIDLTDAEMACSAIISTVTSEIMNLSIKNVNRRTVPIQPWISYGLLHSINRKNYLHKKFTHCPSEANQKTFKTYRNTLNQLIRNAKAHYYKRKIEQTKSNSKKLWDVLLEIIRKKKANQDLPACFKFNGSQLNEPSLIAEKFNDFFVILLRAWTRQFPNPM